MNTTSTLTPAPPAWAATPEALTSFLSSTLLHAFDLLPPPPGAPSPAKERVAVNQYKSSRRNLSQRAAERCAEPFAPELLQRAFDRAGLTVLNELTYSEAASVLHSLGLSGKPRRDLCSALNTALRDYNTAHYELSRTLAEQLTRAAAPPAPDNLAAAQLAAQAAAEAWAEALSLALSSRDTASARRLLEFDAPKLARQLLASGLQPADYGLVSTAE